MYPSDQPPDYASRDRFATSVYCAITAFVLFDSSVFLLTTWHEIQNQGAEPNNASLAAEIGMMVGLPRKNSKTRSSINTKTVNAGKINGSAQVWTVLEALLFKVQKNFYFLNFLKIFLTSSAIMISKNQVGIF